MKAIVMEYKMRKLAAGRILGAFYTKGFLSSLGPTRFTELPDPEIKADDWVIIRPHWCGICGSDTKQIFMDGAFDNPMTAIISWPQVLGHEVVGHIEKVGPAVQSLNVGDRVALNPWLSCAPRELPLCKSCEVGKNTLCRNFTRGILARGIHTGNSKDATGGFAELVPAHESMAVPIPDGVTWEQAVLADPFSVSFHSIMKVRPQPGSVCAVYGCGNLGLLHVHILKRVFEGVKVIAIARFPHQADMAKQFGADLVLKHKPEARIIEQIGEDLGTEVYYPNPKKRKHPWMLEGVDYVFDTVASGETLETGLRIVKTRGTIVVTGVSTPKRFEWTPWYFKEVHVIGSNAFAFEDFEGHFEHAYQHYFRFIQEGRVDPSAIVTHKFPLAKYKDALVATHVQGKSRAIKVVLVHGGDTKEGGE
ncbi:MAG TPA: alcohol dehydrogenase catalytic domain-containing protein [Candidatus Lokiarchaeia archaeon]|nr:alcohol dehydrogenase catalytic domain-containing protein [Candidatus Lokiarchaeia archaeon]